MAKSTDHACRVRTYRQGLGDCFLLSFRKRPKGQFHILIDCGLIAVATQPKDTMLKVANDIVAETGGHLDLVVLTHEHWDHVSGFSQQQAREVFDRQGVLIDHGWYAWTEDKTNKLGQKLRREREMKARAVHRAALAMQATNPLRAASLLTFFGLQDAGTEPLAAKAEGTLGKVRQAFDYLVEKKGTKVEYLHPTDPPRALPGVEDVRVYVLGPPEDEALIKCSDPTKAGREVYEFAAGLTIDESLLASFARMANDSSDVPVGDRDCPFDSYLRLQPGASPALVELMSTIWNRAGDEYRKIDVDWTGAAETLALALDKHTNNTSLALAFEFTKTGRVLLFAADAQVGNWLSWQDLKWDVQEDGTKGTVTGPDLLRRTVLYKVGHHGSHNATLRAKGLEQMTSPDLIALVPVNRAHALKNRWKEMPFETLVARLTEKTRGRVIQSDSAVAPPTPATLQRLSTTERAQFPQMLHVDPDGLYIDLQY